MGEAMANATPPAVGDIEARRVMWEPIIGGADVAQPIPADVKSTDHYATADDGAQITVRWCWRVLAASGDACHPVASPASA